MSAWEEDEHFRSAGPQAMHADDEDAKAKAEERDRKKAEVRKRLEEQGKKKTKKGFLTPERKKKLRKLLMMKAAEDLKQQQLLKEQERTKALESRILPLPDIDSIDDKGKLEQIYNEMFERVRKLEEEKYDINVQVRDKDSEINELTIAVNDLRGKFVKPQLKKVSKYDNKFKSKVQAEGGPAKADFRSNLKVVKKENAIDDLLKVEKKDKPDWKKKSDEGPKEDAPKEEAPKEDLPAEEPVEEDPPADEPAAEEEGEEEEGEDEEEGEEEE